MPRATAATVLLACVRYIRDGTVVVVAWKYLLLKLKNGQNCLIQVQGVVRR